MSSRGKNKIPCIKCLNREIESSLKIMFDFESHKNLFESLLNHFGSLLNRFESSLNHFWICLNPSWICLNLFRIYVKQSWIFLNLIELNLDVKYIAQIFMSNCLSTYAIQRKEYIFIPPCTLHTCYLIYQELRVKSFMTTDRA